MKIAPVMLAAALLAPTAATAQDTTRHDSSGLAAVNPANFDTTCAACKDFFQYANGGWEARTVIPAHYSVYGVDREVQDRNEVLLHRILDDAGRPGADTADAVTRLVGSFYGSCMDSVRAAREGARPLDPLFRRIAAVGTRRDLSRLLGELMRQGIAAGVPMFTYADLAHSDTLRLNSYQGSYGLPDRDYYLKNDSSFVAARRDYRAHLVRMFRLIGDRPDAAAREADQVWRLELALARAAIPTELATKFPQLHHPVQRAALDTLAPHVDWTLYLTGIGAAGLRQLNVMIPAELRAVDSLVGATPLASWRAYLRWRVAHFAAPYLESGLRARATGLQPHRQRRVPAQAPLAALSLRHRQADRRSARPIVRAGRLHPRGQAGDAGPGRRPADRPAAAAQGACLDVRGYPQGSPGSWTP